MLMLHVTKEMTHNKSEWKKMIHVANLKILGKALFCCCSNE